MVLPRMAGTRGTSRPRTSFMASVVSMTVANSAGGKSSRSRIWWGFQACCTPRGGMGGPAEVNEGVEGGADAAAGVEDIVDEDDALAVDIGGELGWSYLRPQVQGG